MHIIANQHRSKQVINRYRITTHYSMAEIDNLLEAVEKIIPDRKQHRILRVA